MCSPEPDARAQVLADLDRLCELATPGQGLGSVSLGPEELTAHVGDLCAFADQVRGRLARLAAALDAAGGPVAAGHATAASFLRGVCGLAPGHASGLVTLGRGLARLTVTGKSLAAGQISADAALVISHAASAIPDSAAAARAERILGDAAARGVGVVDLRQLGEEVAYRADPDAAEERERRRWERRHFSFGLTFGGVGVLSGTCGDSLSAEVIRTAVDAFGPPAGAGDARTAAQRRMDGLVAACKAALDGGGAPTRHSAAPHVTILVEDRTLALAPGAPPGRTGHGAMLTASQVLALCCGAQLTAVRWEDGLPLDIGRAARTESPAIRRALEARDRTCRWPGCDAHGSWCTAHHIPGWRNGARTCLGAMVLLCHMHHANFVHQLGWKITGDPNATLTFRHPAGIIALQSPLPGRARAP